MLGICQLVVKLVSSLYNKQVKTVQDEEAPSA